MSSQIPKSLISNFWYKWPGISLIVKIINETISETKLVCRDSASGHVSLLLAFVDRQIPGIQVSVSFSFLDNITYSILSTASKK